MSGGGHQEQYSLYRTFAATVVTLLSSAHITSGTSQGLILGPTLFSVYRICTWNSLDMFFFLVRIKQIYLLRGIVGKEVRYCYCCQPERCEWFEVLWSGFQRSPTCRQENKRGLNYLLYKGLNKTAGLRSRTKKGKNVQPNHGRKSSRTRGEKTKRDSSPKNQLEIPVERGDSSIVPGRTGDLRETKNTGGITRKIWGSDLRNRQPPLGLAKGSDAGEHVVTA